MHLHFPLRSAFIALPLEGQSKWHFQSLQHVLRDFSDILCFQNPQTPHLTLQYWRALMEIEYQSVLDQAGIPASQTPHFTMHITGADTFGTHGQERVLFLQIAFCEELARLRKACPWVAGTPFHPHITLARIRHPQRFAVQKKRIMKSLQDCSYDIVCDRLRLYAEIHSVAQTPLADFVFGT